MIPLGHSRNVISGRLPSGEQFATSFWCNEAPTGEQATQDQADTFGGELQSAWTHAGSPGASNPSGMVIDTFTAYSYLDNSGRASFVAQHGLNLAGSAGGEQLPNQVALVATLQTGSAGRRNRGRMYWPWLAPSLSGGQLQQSAAAAFAGWLSDLVTAWNSHLGDQHVVVLSQRAGSSKSVSAIKVDTRLDIQRRRANGEAINGVATVPVQ